MIQRCKQFIKPISTSNKYSGEKTLGETRLILFWPTNGHSTQGSIHRFNVERGFGHMMSLTFTTVAAGNFQS